MRRKRSGISTKNPGELKIMRAGGKITAQVLREVLDSVRPGISLKELDGQAERLILGLGAKPSFKTVENYGYATCINVNEGVVHGIPSERVIKEGDIVSVDLGACYKGFHTDAAWTVLAGAADKFPQLGGFLEVGKQALSEALKQCHAGRKLSNISRAIQDTIEGAGYCVVRDLVGHGIGRSLHEPPEVPGYVRDGGDLELEPGLVLAIEVIYNKGDYPVVVDRRDGWTIRSRDGSISALFEQTVGLSETGPIVLTELAYGKKGRN